MTVEAAEFADRIAVPHKVLFNANAKTIALTFNGTDYTIFKGQEQSTLKMPSGWTLLALNDVEKGYAYIRAENRVVKWHSRNEKFKTTTICQDLDPSIQAVGFSPMNDSLFGLEVSNTGTPLYFLPLLDGRRHRITEPLDLTEAVMRATTVRIDL